MYSAICVAATVEAAPGTTARHWRKSGTNRSLAPPHDATEVRSFAACRPRSIGQTFSRQQSDLMRHEQCHASTAASDSASVAKRTTSRIGTMRRRMEGKVYAVPGEVKDGVRSTPKNTSDLWTATRAMARDIKRCSVYIKRCSADINRCSADSDRASLRTKRRSSAVDRGSVAGNRRSLAATLGSLAATLGSMEATLCSIHSKCGSTDITRSSPGTTVDCRRTELDVGGTELDVRSTELAPFHKGRRLPNERSSARATPVSSLLPVAASPRWGEGGEAG
jgi:hypothetical protein